VVRETGWCSRRRRRRQKWRVHVHKWVVTDRIYNIQLLLIRRNYVQRGAARCIPGLSTYAARPRILTNRGCTGLQRSPRRPSRASKSFESVASSSAKAVCEKASPSCCCSSPSAIHRPHPLPFLPPLPPARLPSAFFPPPLPRRLSNIGSGRRCGADAGSLIAHSYAVAVAGGRRRGGEAVATAGKRVWDGRARRWRRGAEAVATGGRGRRDGRQVGGDGRQVGGDGQARPRRRAGEAAATEGRQLRDDGAVL